MVQTQIPQPNIGDEPDPCCQPCQVQHEWHQDSDSEKLPHDGGDRRTQSGATSTLPSDVHTNHAKPNEARKLSVVQ